MKLGSEIRAVSERPVIRCLALLILFAMWTRFEPLSTAVLDPDLWWHLRGGDAIIAQHAVPHHAVFTRHTERAWVEYSWGFEVIASRFYHWFGLMGLVNLRFLLEVIVSATLFVIGWRGLDSFWQALGLTVAGMWGIHHCLTLQPMLASIVMFTFEIALIFEARRRNTMRPLYVLPFMFLVWANLHIQFVYGIAILLLLSGVSLMRAALPSNWASRLEPDEDLPLIPVSFITVSSVLATLVGPYSWHLYGVLLGYIQSSAPYTIITELRALSFRYPEHFGLALVLFAGFFALGWRRSRDPFKLILLTACTLIGLRMTRDSWVACVPAMAIIADRRMFSPGERAGRTVPRKIAFAAITAVATVLMFTMIEWDSKLSNSSLSRVVAENFPADACNFIRAHSLSGPLYNDMDWGGFLIWALPDVPVAIDNRTDLYGDDILSRFYFVRVGLRDWKADPDLDSARLVLLNRSLPLANLLAQDPHFRLLYQDRLAAVFSHDVTGTNVSRAYDPSKGARQSEISSR
jgi:hypothetical protein